MSNIRVITRGAYDVQKLRIQIGNRIVGNFKAKLGQSAGKTEAELEKEEKEILEKLRLHYKKITDGVKTFPRHSSFKGDEVISDYTELCLLAQYVDLEQQEAQHFRRLGAVLQDYPIYVEFLEGVKGCGIAMSAVIISEIDIHCSKYASSIWKYAGYDVAADGKGRSRRKEHQIDVEYIGKDGKPATKKSITFNPFLKTKLFILAGCLLKASGPYKEYYDGYKNRLEQHPAHQGKSKGHRHSMAMRYMIKRFLADLYRKWREIEGLEVHNEYAEGKLGMRHGIQ